MVAFQWKALILAITILLLQYLLRGYELEILRGPRLPLPATHDNYVIFRKYSSATTAVDETHNDIALPLFVKFLSCDHKL